jgi:hypothetical protein
MPPSNAGSTSSIVSVAIGVILGAALTFGMQLHFNRVQDRRIAHQTRAQHLERLMIATKGIKTATLSFAIRVFDAAVKEKAGLTPSFENLMPDLGPAAEMGAVCALYVPEVNAEVQRLVQAYYAMCQGYVETITRRGVTAKLRDHSVPTANPVIDKKLAAELSEATQVLENKLIELAKRNRQ